MAGVSAKGSKLYLKSGTAFAESDVIAHLTSIGEIGGDVDELETTDLDSGDYKEFAPSMKDGGTISIAGNFVAGSTGYTRLKALFDKSPTDPTVFGDFGISHPIITEANCGFNAYVSSLKVGERTPTGLVTFTADLRVNGAIGDFIDPSVKVDLSAVLATKSFDYQDSLTNTYSMPMSNLAYVEGDDLEVIVTGNFSAAEFTDTYPSSPDSPFAIIEYNTVVVDGAIDDALFNVELVKALASIVDEQAYYVANATTKDRQNTVITYSGSLISGAVVTVSCDNHGDATMNVQLQNSETLVYIDSYVQGA